MQTRRVEIKIEDEMNILGATQVGNIGNFIKRDLQSLHDEGWWASVMSDEEAFSSSSNCENQPIINSDAISKLSTGGYDWKFIEDIFLNDTVVEVLVENYNRGGLLVGAKEIQGFVPASHLINVPYDCDEEKRIEYYQAYLHQRIKVKVIECEQSKERVVFSERAALAGEGKRKELINSLREGVIIDGIVTNITSFGVFLDLGGMEGLIHVSELSWKRIKNPAELLSVGEIVQVQVLKINEGDGKIALSRKRLFPNPWLDFAESHATGDVINATITSIMNYGAFAQTQEGIEGLIHISSLNHLSGKKIQDTLKSGEQVQVKIHSIDVDKRRLSLILIEEKLNG